MATLARNVRGSQVRAGVRVEAYSFAWMVVEAAVAIAAGIAARSVLLTSFGADSVIELVTGGILLWRLVTEARGDPIARVELAERRSRPGDRHRLGVAVCLRRRQFRGRTRHARAFGRLLRGHPAGWRCTRHHAGARAAQARHRRPNRQRRPARRRGMLGDVRVHGRDAPGGTRCSPRPSVGGGPTAWPRSRCSTGSCRKPARHWTARGRAVLRARAAMTIAATTEPRP